MNGRRPSLIEATAALLASGPRHTLEIGEGVMRLRGNPGAVSAAVHFLLGADERFEVDGSGVWNLVAGAARPGPPLDRTSFAVVDVETTGGSWGQGHRVTEVAIVAVDEGRIGESFHTLVNPGRYIPPWVQGLTGITNAMVASAPHFDGIAHEVEARLRGRVFVAHNVSFDWGFISGELLRSSGAAPDPPRLCTVRLGRLVVPRLRRYGLDFLTNHYGIHVHDRHRAHGDALATARLLLHLLLGARERGIHDIFSLQEALKPPSGRREGARPLRRVADP